MATPPVFVSGAVLTAAQMNDVGMWKVHSSAYTTVSSVTINNVFTSDFRNYKLMLSQTTGASTGLVTIQFTVAGVATTTGYTERSIIFHATPSPGAETFSNLSGVDELTISMSSSNVDSSKNTSAEATIFEPQTANRTKLHSLGATAFGGNPINWQVHMGLQTAATQFDGCKVLFPGNATGTISIYGLRD